MIVGGSGTATGAMASVVFSTLKVVTEVVAVAKILAPAMEAVTSTATSVM
jgi:hypothetical protein